MKMSIIGMSNAGKTYWSRLLKKFMQFKRYSCDDLIEEKLKPELKKHGFSGIHDVSKWMGQPYEERYKQNSQKYLACEIKTMEEILKALAPDMENKKDVVIDTTGSLIYTGKKLMQQLKISTKIVYLETPQSVKEEMLRLYLENPKPVFWGKSFSNKNGETNKEALRRCYSKLLAYRTQEYKKYADIVLDYYEVRVPQFTVEDFYEKCQ